MNRDAGKPIVIDNTVYLIKGNTLFAFDAGKGKFRWSSVFDSDVGEISLVNSRLYVYSFWLNIGGNNDKFYVVDPTNGKFKVYRVPQGGLDAPTVNGVRYYVGGSNPIGPNPRGPNLYALKLSNQKQLWHQQFAANQTLTLGNVAVKNGIVYVPSMILASGNRKNSAGLLYAFDATTGKQLWKSFEMPVGIRNFMVADDMVYCASIGDLDAFDSHTGKHIWHLHSNTVDLLVNAGVLYINYITNTISYDGGIEALQAKNGKKLWQTSFTGTGEHNLLGLQRGIIYTIADNGTVGNIDALKASDGTRLWNLSINGDATKLEAAVA
jgi:outer membrane protein assembly factor BamB